MRCTYVYFLLTHVSLISPACMHACMRNPGNPASVSLPLFCEWQLQGLAAPCAAFHEGVNESPGGEHDVTPAVLRG